MRPSTAQSHLRFPLTHLLAGGGHVRVLRALSAYGAPLSVPQLAADTGLTPRGVRFVLGSLESQGIVQTFGKVRSQVFAIVNQHPLAPALRALFEQERVRWEDFQAELRAGLASLKEVRSAWLYGSVSRGEDAPHSDVDIALVVDAESPGVMQGVRDAIHALGDRLKAPITPVVLTASDVAKLDKGDRWWSDVTRDAVVLKGVSPAMEAMRCAR